MTAPSDAFLPYGHQSIDEDDVAAVVDVLKSDWLTTGPNLEAFESAMAQKVKGRFGIAVNSGTAALHCACMAAGLGEGTEAVVPVLTFAATANAVRLSGAEVRFVDIDPGTLGLSSESIAPVLSSKTRAVLPVDFAGQPCDWDAINGALESRQVVTIADAAHALGATYKGQPVGSLADMTCFSFHPVKVITTAEGGMIVTQSADYAEELKKLRNHGLVRKPEDLKNKKEAFPGANEVGSPAPWYYEVQDIGVNYRMSEMQCALGLSQLNKLESFINKRRSLASHYTAAFSNSDLFRPPTVADGGQSAWHLYVIRLNLPALSTGRREIFEALRDRGLGVQVHYTPLHLQPYYRTRYGLERGDFPVAEAYYDEAITLPLFPSMKMSDADRVVETVFDVLSANKR